MQPEIQEAKEDLAMTDATNLAKDAVRTGKAVYRGYRDLKKGGSDLYRWLKGKGGGRTVSRGSARGVDKRGKITHANYAWSRKLTRAGKAGRRYVRPR
jgi:hypothetical protein